jgi:hypothetical protein
MGDRTTAEYYVAECMVKCSQAILGARIYQAAKPVVDKRASKWVSKPLLYNRAAACSTTTL